MFRHTRKRSARAIVHEMTKWSLIKAELHNKHTYYGSAVMWESLRLLYVCNPLKCVSADLKRTFTSDSDKKVPEVTLPRFVDMFFGYIALCYRGNFQNAV